MLWSGLPFPCFRGSSAPRDEPCAPAPQADSVPLSQVSSVSYVLAPLGGGWRPHRTLTPWASLVTSCQAGHGGTAIDHGVPVARMTGEGCVAQWVSEGEGPLSQIQFPPEGRCSARKPQAGTPLPRPVPTQRGPPWDGSVPSALHPPPGRRALRACPGPQACSLGLATLGTSRACWAFLLGLGPSAETLVLLCILSPPGPRGEASQGLLRSGLPSVQLSAKGPSGLPGGPGVPTRLSLPEHVEAVGPLPLPLIPGRAGGRPGPAPTGSPEEDTLLGDWLWSPIPAPHIFGLAMLPTFVIAFIPRRKHHDCSHCPQ